MAQRGWFRRKVIGPFIDSDVPNIVVSALAGFALVLYAPRYLIEKYSAFYSGIPATALGLMGFVLTAAAIVVSVQDKGMIRHYKKQNPPLWEATKHVFFMTARLLGCIGIAVFLVGVSFYNSPPGSLAFFALGFYLQALASSLVFAVLQLNKMIYVLSKLMDAALDSKQASQIDKEIEEENRPD